MNNYTISIFGNKIFFEIISELKYFSTFKVKYYNDIEKCVNEPNEKSQIIVYFLNDTNKFIFNKNTIIKHPVLLVNKFLSKKNIFNEGIEQINMPFTIIDFEQKITSIIAKNNYKKNSFISLGSYVINKYERKIKKDNLELQLSEKEINFLILFSKTTRPLSRNFVLRVTTSKRKLIKALRISIKPICFGFPLSKASMFTGKLVCNLVCLHN